MIERPVRVVGAGVSGLMAAIRLAQVGARVEVYEREADSGANHPPRFDGIENWTTHADLMELQWNWKVELPLRRSHAFEVFDSHGRAYPADFDRPLFYVVRRGVAPGSLEQALKQQALHVGVRLRYGASLAPDEADIWAVGARVPGRFLSASLTFRTSHPDVVRVVVDRRLTPKGYAYLIVGEGEATLSVVLTRQFKQARQRLDDVVRTFQHLRPFEMLDVRASGGTGGLIDAFRRPTIKPLTVGEAAGFQDYLWGFGIRYALETGDLAARALADSTDYARLVAQDIRPLVESSLVLRMLYDRVGDRGDRALIRHMASVEDPGAILRYAYRARAVRATLWPLARPRRPASVP